jgi:hypothetical protein
MQMFVFAKDDIMSRISQVEKSVENTGFLGIFPNKGKHQFYNCIYLSFWLHSSMMVLSCFYHMRPPSLCICPRRWMKQQHAYMLSQLCAHIGAFPIFQECMKILISSLRSTSESIDPKGDECGQRAKGSCDCTTPYAFLLSTVVRCAASVLVQHLIVGFFVIFSRFESLSAL